MRVAHNPTCQVSLHKKGESGHRNICEDEGRDKGNASTDQETPKVAGKPLEAKTDLEQSPSQGTSLVGTIILDFRPPEL